MQVLAERATVRDLPATLVKVDQTAGRLLGDTLAVQIEEALRGLQTGTLALIAGVEGVVQIFACVHLLRQHGYVDVAVWDPYEKCYALLTEEGETTTPGDTIIREDEVRAFAAN